MAEPVFAALAAALLAPAAPVPPEVAELLHWLGLPRPAEPGPAEQHRALLFRAAAGFERLFQLEAPDAPGMAVWGAEARPTEPGHAPFSISGTGSTPLEALESCIGEGIELLSQVETTADRARQRETAPSSLPPPFDTSTTGWMPVRQLSDGAKAWVPASLALRRPGGASPLGAPPWPLSIGCGAGTSLEAAALHGLLELVERDAAALWWRGGARPRPLALEHPAVAQGAALLATLRRGQPGRRSWLLDITTDLGIPAVAAVSLGPDGRGFCCGTAARPGLGAASRAAVLELCQMELALAVVAAKRAEAGAAALNPRDLGHLARATAIGADCALLHPMGAPAEPKTVPPGPPAQQLARLVGLLVAQGLQPLLLDLTRPGFGVPVCRVLCPGLEAEPSGLAGPRLRASIAKTGGGDCHHGGNPLM